ncbi:cd7 antigen-like [Esox lucius]|uniref:cd7 antigen-like n=1 Tax=Esox lucius TaxID=8010 RepID=UPI0010BCF1A0|nr:cd7 antigen-like [Esox lucius]
MRTPHLVTLSTPLLVGRYLTASELMEIQKRLAGVWIFFFTHSFLVSCEIRFLGKQLGDSATFVCVSDVQDPKPIAFNLKRKWIKPDREVMFMYTKEKPAPVPDFSQRLNVTGDPSTERVNVTISQLKGTDTDLYYCLFVYPKTNAPDENIPGKDEFFLYVDDADVPDTKMDIGFVQTNAGGSVVLPCLAPYGSPSAIEGVCLKRRQGRAPVEVLFHTRSQSSAFPQERILHRGIGLGGLGYNITLTQMQLEESAFYSCELLVPGSPENHARLGRHVYFVSVKDVSCSCSGYVPLLYALSAAVGLLLILLLALAVAHYGKIGHDRVKPQSSIYEEMVGGRPPNRNRKTPPSYLRPPHHLEEMNAPDYDHPPPRSRHENLYERPDGALLIPTETAVVA